MRQNKIGQWKNVIANNPQLRELADSEPKVKLTGQREAVITGCSGVSEYGSERISLITDRIVTVVTGKNLELFSLNEEEAIVRGTILSIELQ